MTRSLSIVVPAYNEEKRLGATLEGIARYFAKAAWNFREVLVVDDGSTDRTAEVAAGFPGARLLRNPGNRGKGYAVRHGMLEAGAEWVLFSDADLATPIEEIEKLWEAVERDGVDVAIGSRALDRALIGIHQPLAREASGRIFNLVMRAVTGLPFRDTQCGCKLFRTVAARETFKRQLLDGFGFDVEVLVIANVLGYRVAEVPVRWNDVAGTKVSMAKGMDAFADLLRVRRNLWLGKYGR